MSSKLDQSSVPMLLTSGEPVQGETFEVSMHGVIFVAGYLGSST
jgi:hypothetical protein